MGRPTAAGTSTLPLKWVPGMGAPVPVWSDRDWQSAVESQRIGVDPWAPTDLTPNGLDLRIGSVLVPATENIAIHAGAVPVPAGARFLIGTAEVIRMPVDAVGLLWIRSSWARKGVLASFGKVDAGFEGNLTIGCFNAGIENLVVPVGERFCQLVVEELATPSDKAYAARSGNYQNQRGITMAKR